jgi:polysaccharide biosynthesis transport protein
MRNQWLENAWATLTRHKLKFLTGYVAFVVGVIFLLAQSAPIYETNSIISIQPAARSDGAQLNRQETPLSVEQAARSQIALLESEEVIRRAIDKVGAKKFASQPSHISQWLEKIKGRSRRLSAPDAAFLEIRDALDARFEPNTSLITVRFRDNDPLVSKDVTNALVDSFTERYYEVYSGGGGVNFFRAQQKRSAKNFEDLSAKLAAFARANNVFDVAEQRRLLLQERTRLATALVTTQGEIRQQSEQAVTIPEQLAKMKPVGRLPQVIGLTEGASDARRQSGKEEDAAQTARLAANPPLLLVKVYQDTIATLVKLKIDLSGLRALEQHQIAMLKNADEQLSVLSSKEAEFERLRLDVSQARQGTEIYNRRTLDEQLEQDLNASMLAGVRVVQRATIPLSPIWPTARLLIAIGFILLLLPLLLVVGRYLSAAIGHEYDLIPPLFNRPNIKTHSVKSPNLKTVVKHRSNG